MRFIIFDTVVLFVALIGSIIEKRKIDKQEKKKGGRHGTMSRQVYRSNR